MFTDRKCGTLWSNKASAVLHRSH